MTLAAVDPFASYASTDLAADLSLYASSLSKYNSYNSYNARAPGLNAQTNDAVTDAESQMLLVVEQECKQYNAELAAYF